MFVIGNSMFDVVILLTVRWHQYDFIDTTHINSSDSGEKRRPFITGVIGVAQACTQTTVPFFPSIGCGKPIESKPHSFTTAPRISFNFSFFFYYSQPPSVRKNILIEYVNEMASFPFMCGSHANEHHHFSVQSVARITIARVCVSVSVFVLCS